MASSGDFWAKPVSGRDFGVHCYWTATKTANGNYSDVSVSLYLNVYNIGIGARTASENTLTVAGTTVNFATKELDRSGASSYTEMALTDSPIVVRVPHDADGTKTNISISFSYHYNGSYYSQSIPYITGSKTGISLDAIPVYKLTKTQGTNTTITVNRTSSGYSGASTGNLANNATLYTGDKLKISFAASANYAVATHTVNGSAFTSGNTHTVSGNVAVVSSASALASTVSATNANIGGTSTITVTKGNSSYAHSLYFSFGSSSPVTGYIKSDGTISSTEVKYTNTSVSFSVPTSFYAIIQSAKSGTCTITCKTYNSASSSTQVGSSQTCTFTATAAESACKPEVSGTVVDINDTTTTLTGNSSKLVRYKSTAQCTITANAMNSAEIRSKTINNAAPNSSDQKTYANVNTNSFVFKATDSRGYSNSATVNPTIVEYVPLTLVPSVKRAGSTSSTVAMTFKGNVFHGDFGAFSNKVIVRYRYKLASSGTYSNWHVLQDNEISYTGNTYKQASTITIGTDFDYREAYDVQITAYDGSNDRTTVTDCLSSVTKTVRISQGMPVFDWGKNSFRVNGDAIGTIYGLAGAGISVPSGTDLNIYTEPGVYAVESNDVAASLTNCPSIIAGTLRIWSSNGRSGPVTESWRYRCEEYTDLHMNVWRRSGFTGNVSGDYSQYPERPFAWNADWTPVDVSESYTATEGTWTCRRFASGDVILWGKFTVTPTQEAQSGGLYYSQTVYINLPFPVTNAAVTGSAQNLYFVANAGVNSSSATSNPNTVWFRLLHATTISGNQTVDLHVCGKWK